MLLDGLVKIIALFFSTCIMNLVSSSEMSEESWKEPKSHSEELANSISSLDWIAKLSQHESLLYSKLRSRYNHAIMRLNNYKSHMDDEEYIINTVNELFRYTMRSDFMADKIKTLQAVDQLLNDKTAEHLAKKHLNNFKDIPGAIEFLTVDGIRPIDKNADSARALLSTGPKNSLVDLSTVDSSIWFLINQQKFCSDPLEKFEAKIKDKIGNGIIKHQIILRADVDFRLLFGSMDEPYRMYNEDLVSRWYRYMVKEVPFGSAHSVRHAWELVGELFLSKDPKFVADLLNTSFAGGNKGNRNYLLLFHENPVKRLLKSKPTDPYGLYCCFLLGLNVDSFYDKGEISQKISRERLAELASYFVELQKKSMLSIDHVELQRRLPYLKLASLLKDNNYLDTDYAKRFTQNPKTFELLDVIGDTLIEGIGFPIKSFSAYLLENSNWDKAVEEHFHHYISEIMLYNSEILARNFDEYFGINVGADNDQTESIIENCNSDNVNYTLDKIPRHLNSLFKVIEEQDRKETSATKRLEIAVWGSVFHDETIGIADKKEFVNYILKGPIDGVEAINPVFVNLARIHYKYKDVDIEEIEAFVYFEHLVYNCFSNLERMDLERAFQRVSTKDSFSIAFKNLIMENFKWCELPLVLANLQMLEKEILKYNPDTALLIQLESIPVNILLKAIYETLGDDCTDLKLVITKHLLNAQLQHVGSA